MAFEQHLTVRFHEVDRAGIVYFGRVFEYCHVTFEAMLEAALGDLEEFFRTSAWAMPLVHAEADYQRPMRLGDRLVVRLRVERLGARSVTFGYEVRGAVEDDLRATARLVHSCVDRATFASIPAPGLLRQGLARLGLWTGPPSPPDPAH